MWSTTGRTRSRSISVTVGDHTVEFEDAPGHWQPVAYCAPDESLRYNVHCSVSDVTLTYRLDGEDPVTVESLAGRAEWVGSDPTVSGEYRPPWD